jgi:hypothetical protein
MDQDPTHFQLFRKLAEEHGNDVFTARAFGAGSNSQTVATV